MTSTKISTRLLILCLSLSCSVTSAVIIEADLNAPGDGLLTRDTIQGLDFLDLTPTIGLSFADVSAELGVGGNFEGFRYATRPELVNLVNNFGFDPGADTGGWVRGTTSPQLFGLIDLLGQTNTPGSSGWTIAEGLYVRDNGFAGTYAVVESPIGTFAGNPPGSGGSGHFLVLEPAAVPEPSSFLCLGLMALVASGLNWSRKRRQV